MYIYPGSPRPKQRMVFSMIHVKDSLLLVGKVWSLDFLGELTKTTFGENQVSGRILGPRKEEQL